MLSVLFSGTIGSFPDPRHEALSDMGSLSLSLFLSCRKADLYLLFRIQGTFRRLATFYYYQCRKYVWLGRYFFAWQMDIGQVGHKETIKGQHTWVLKGPVIEKKHPSFLLMPNCHKLRENSKNVSLKIGS